MTYILTDGELQTLISISGQETNDMACVTLNDTSKRKIMSGNLEYRASGLIKTGLLEVGPDGKYRATHEGRLAAGALCAPETSVCIGRKNTSDPVFKALKYNGLWIVYGAVSEQKLNMLTLYFSAATLGDWIDEQFVRPTPKDVEASDSINVTFSYDEWYLWLMSQLVFTRRDLTDKQGRLYFDTEELCNQTALTYLADSLRALGRTEAFDSLHGIFVSPMNRRILNAIKGLVKKGILNAAVEKDRELKLSYTDTAINWLDNDMLTDTLFFSKQKNGKHNAMILQLRRTGICAIYDTGSAVKAVTIGDIPWSAYLEG